MPCINARARQLLMRLPCFKNTERLERTLEQIEHLSLSVVPAKLVPTLPRFPTESDLERFVVLAAQRLRFERERM